LAAEAVPARAGLPFDADDQNRQRTGGFTGPIRLNKQGRFAGQQVYGPAGFDLLGTASLLSRSEAGSAAPRRDSGLETPGRRFRPQQQEGQSTRAPHLSLAGRN